LRQRRGGWDGGSCAAADNPSAAAAAAFWRHLRTAAQHSPTQGLSPKQGDLKRRDVAFQLLLKARTATTNPQGVWHLFLSLCARAWFVVNAACRCYADKRRALSAVLMANLFGPRPETRVKSC
jgi:hypothetical protein